MNDLEPWRIWCLTAILVAVILETTAAKIRPVETVTAVATAETAPAPTQPESHPDESASRGVEYAAYSPGAPHHWYLVQTNIAATMVKDKEQLQFQHASQEDWDARDSTSFADETVDVAGSLAQNNDRQTVHELSYVPGADVTLSEATTGVVVDEEATPIFANYNGLRMVDGEYFEIPAPVNINALVNNGPYPAVKRWVFPEVETESAQAVGAQFGEIDPVINTATADSAAAAYTLAFAVSQAEEAAAADEAMAQQQEQIQAQVILSRANYSRQLAESRLDQFGNTDYNNYW